MTSHFLSVGRLIPILLLTTAVTETSMRFVPTKDVAFRAWEAAISKPNADGPFTPNFHYENPKAYGDLSAVANLPRLRQYHAERFTTDPFGFRVTPGGPPYGILLLGNSFAVGSGVSDDETLAALLEKDSGVGVYNAAGMEIHLPDIVKVVYRLGMTRGTVVFQYSNWQILPTNKEFFGQAPPPDIETSEPKALGFWKVSPFQIWVKRFYQQWQNKFILPAVGSDRVTRLQLRDGQEMLVYTSNIDRFYGQHQAPDIGTFKLLQHELQKMNLKLLVLLTPDKFTIYQPLLLDSVPKPHSSYLNNMEGMLRRSGIRAMNLEPIFQARAAEELEKGRLIYWKDDSHWNQEGIRIAAKACANALR
jgi:hypothetical protein